MKSTFLKQTQSDTLTLFFLGWSMDATPFADYVPADDSDLMLVWDYTKLRLPKTLLKPYKAINLFAWSMGVWAAERVLSDDRIISATAIHGTPSLADNELGIPVVIFNSTLRTLTPATLDRFNRRMCGNAAAYEAFNEHCPQRSFESQRSELEAVSVAMGKHPKCALTWTRAFAGERDMIFPVANVQRSFPQAITTPSAHYNESLMRHLIQGGL